MLSPADLLRVKRLRACGVVVPVRCLLAARKTGLALHVAASILVQETGGGRNVWGHDPSIFSGGFDRTHGRQWGESVTRDSYLAYKLQRGTTGRGGMQGVGPCQLTYWSLQDEADRLGGCWKVTPNLLVGFGHLAASIRSDGLRAAVASYNGSGAAAQAYANQVLDRADRFRKALKT